MGEEQVRGGRENKRNEMKPLNWSSYLTHEHSKVRMKEEGGGRGRKEEEGEKKREKVRVERDRMMPFQYPHTMFFPCQYFSLSRPISAAC